MPVVSDMDYIRATIAQAAHNGVTSSQLMACAEHAATPEAFDNTAKHNVKQLEG
jgi:uncharacterized protein (DUF1499 family)